MFTVLNSGNWAEQYETIGERVFLSVTMTLVGIGIVVVILALLSVVVALMTKVINRRRREKAPASDSAPVEAFSLPQVPPQTEAADETAADDSAVAAITGSCRDDDERPVPPAGRFQNSPDSQSLIEVWRISS